LDRLNADFDKDNKLARQKTTTSDETRIEGLDQFQEHADLFQDLTKRQFIDTKVDVVNGVITYDSKNCVVICSKDAENMELQSYSLTPPYAQQFLHAFEGRWLKMNIIEQDSAGARYAVAFQDDGHFRVLVITNQGEQIVDLDVASIIGTDSGSKPLSGFHEPLVSAVFLPNDDPERSDEPEEKILISAYHRFEKT
jgi:hypothetical protein